MPVLRNRPLLYRARRPFDLQQRVGLLLGTQGLVSDNFRDRATVSVSNGFDGYGADVLWVVRSGAFSCSQGKLNCTSAGILSCDPGVADASRYEAAVTFTPDADNNGFLFRYLNTTNYLALFVTSTALQFASVISGSLTNIGAASTGVTPAMGDVIRWSVIGNSFAAQCYRAGIAVGTQATASVSTGSGRTFAGFISASTNLSIGYYKVRRS